MATYNGSNYAKQWVTKPSEKLDRGEQAGIKRLLKEEYTLLTGTTYALNDEILGPKLPMGALVTDAKIFVEGSTGVTGIFTLGHLASANDHAKDVDAFVVGADAGGQAVLQRMGASNVGAFKRFTEEVQLVINVSEATPAMAGDVKIHVEVEYVID